MRRRGSVTFIVMWALAIGAIVLSSVQLFSARQSMMGRTALARTQARWAARGGLEWMISIMNDHTERPVADDAFAMVRELEDYSTGDLEAEGRIVASWDIRHHADGREWRGPMDEHSKLNINRTLDDPSLLQRFDEINPDVADAILDWIDEDDDERALGAERNYYLTLSLPYEPRNARMRSIGEFELVAGVWPEHLRGEDWNLNNRLDGNEDDGDRTWPPDEPDEVFDPKLSGLLTAYSIDGRLTGSGMPRLDLTSTTVEEIQERFDFEPETAQALIDFAGTGTATVGTLLTNQIAARLRSTGGMRGSTRGQQPQQQAEEPANGLTLTDDQLRLVLAETSFGPVTRGPGLLNINTASEELLLQLLEGREHLVDEILYLRNSRTGGITSLADLIDIPAFRDDTASLEYVAGLFDVRSSVYAATIKGRSWTGNLEFEIFAVIDRSTVPARILEYRE